MSAGTLKLTNGSTAVTGTGTSFTTDLTTADFVVVTVGGTTHSLAVDSVTNATALVLSAPFTGPTTASVAWQAVPRKAMLRVTAELNRQVTEALRLGNENAINWQAVLSADDTATVVLPDGTTLTGLSWKKLSEIMTDMDIDAIKPLAAQIHTDAAQVAADKPVIVQAKTDAIAAKNAAAGSQTAAAGSATAAAGLASTATTQADRAKIEADRAQSANPDNQLKKANNLNDVANVATARTNLQIDRLSQDSTDTRILSPTKNSYLTVGGAQWGVYNSTLSAWSALGVAQGGTGALTAANARTNLQVIYQSPASLSATDNLNDFNGTKIGEYFQSQSVNATPANNYPTQIAGGLKIYMSSGGDGGKACVQEYRTHINNRLFMRNLPAGGAWSDWVEFQSTRTVVSIINGGTGRTDGTLEAKGNASSDLISAYPVNAGQNTWIALKDSSGAIRWRIGRASSNGSFQFIGYAADGSTTGAAGAVLEIDNTTGEIKSTKAITTSGIITGGMLTVSGSAYPNMRFLPLYTDSTVIPDTVVGGLTFFELSQDKANTTSSLGLIRRSKTGGQTGQIVVSFPSTAGTIALQGTSGIDYKHDVTDADYSEAIARIDSLRMVNFVYNDDEQNRVRFGVIAEEVELTAPQYIKHNQEQYEDILDENGEKVGAKYRDRPSVDVNPIVMDLLGYVKDLRKEIDALRDEIKALKTGGVKEDDSL